MAGLRPAFAMPDGERARAFLADLLDARDIASPDERAAKLRAVFSENGDLLQAFLDPNKAQEILKEAGVDAPLPIELQNPSVIAIREGLQKTLAPLTDDSRRAFLEKVPTPLLDALSDQLESRLDKVELSRVPAIGKVHEQLQTVKLNGFSKDDVDFLGKTFLSYFDQAPIAIKRRMISGWLRVPPGAPWPDQLAAVLQNAGPSLQKFFQLLGRESSSAELTAVSTQLLSSVRPVPFAKIKALIEADQGKPLSQLYRSFDEKAFKAGTVGQVHKAVTVDGRETVVKVLRPGIRKEMTDELDLLLKLTDGNAPSHTLISEAKKSFLAELDLTAEANNFRRATTMYADSSKGLAVPEVIDEVPPTQNVLTLEKVRGATLDGSAAVDPRVRAAALQAVTDKWFEKAMTTGFFHGDLHPGNVMLMPHLENPAVPYLATYLDFGAVGELSLAQRRGIMLLYAAADEGNTDHVLRALETAFAQIPPDKREELSRQIAAILAAPAKLTAEKLNEIIGMALKSGMKLDQNVVMFSRTTFFLSRELDRVNAEVQSKFPGTKVLMPGTLFRKVAIRTFGQEIWQKISNSASRREGVWNMALLRKLAAATTAKSVRKVKTACSVLFGQLSWSLTRPAPAP